MRVEHCEAANTQHILSILEATSRINAATLRDFDLGARSVHGLTTFFGTDYTQSFPRSTVSAMVVLRAKQDLLPTRFVKQRPRFVCVNENSKRDYPSLRRDPWTYCLISSEYTFYVLDTAYIFLCPGFFTLSQQPIHNVYCPILWNNAFQWHPNFLLYQVYVLNAQLARFYLGTRALSEDSNPREVTDLNLCVGLRDGYSLYNTPSIISYGAMVDQGCVAVPDTTRPPWNLGIGLPSTLNNDTNFTSGTVWGAFE